MSKLPAQHKPWEQYPDETATAYHRFSVYLELGPDRSISKVATELQKGSGYATHLRRWSAKYDWVARSREYDKHIIKKTLKNKEDVLDKARGRLLKKVDQALDVVFDIMTMEDYSFSEGHSSNINQKLKAAQYVLETAGLVAPESAIDPSKNEDDATYIQNIYNRIENHYGNSKNNEED